MSELKMPERQHDDGPVSVRIIGDVYMIEATQGRLHTHLECSEYNAWRILGALSVVLKVPLSKAAQKAIKF